MPRGMTLLQYPLRPEVSSPPESGFSAMAHMTHRHSDEHKYLNIPIKWPLNVIRIHIRAISLLQICSDIPS